MTRRLLTSLGAATILASVLLATPLRVSADSAAGAQVQRADDGTTEDTAMDPCLPAKPNRVIGDAAARDLFRHGFRRRPIPVLGRKGVLAFARTELFFGTDKPEGPPVSDEDFRGFLDNQITPRFPDGLTVVKGDGQFRDEAGDIIQEASFILILLYPIESVNDSNRRIESIRRCYLHQFDQESVLRVDAPFASWVSF